MKANYITTEILSEQDLQLIRTESKAIENNGRLTLKIVDLIVERGWLKIMEPRNCGGQAWSLPKIVQLLEALAYADGNVGWCVNLGAGANLFAGYLPEETALKIFTPQGTWCAGSGAITGRAYRTNGGYRLSGQWKYASGSVHATHFTANGWLFDESGHQIFENDKAAFRSFIFPAEVVKVKNTWHVTGLKATSSNDFEVSNVFVPSRQVFSLRQPSPFSRSPLFHFSFDALAVVNMACMATGMALHFLELTEDLIQSKTPLNSTQKLGKQDVVLKIFDDVKAQFLTDRQNMFDALKMAWEPVGKGNKAIEKDLKKLINKSRVAAESARRSLFRLFPLCGMTVVYEDTKLNKVWRDLSVAGQHYLLSPMAK